MSWPCARCSGAIRRRPDTYQAGLDTVTQLLRQGAQLHVPTQPDPSGASGRCSKPERQSGPLPCRNHAGRGARSARRLRDCSRALHQRTHTAEEADYPAGMAQSHHYLAMLAGRHGVMAEALPHFEQAIDFYERVGESRQPGNVRSNLASVHPDRPVRGSVGPAEQAMRFFEAMATHSAPPRTPNLAEAHAELGNPGTRAALRRAGSRQEEPHSHPYAL